jgi:hypothetical protein
MILYLLVLRCSDTEVQIMSTVQLGKFQRKREREVTERIAQTQILHERSLLMREEFDKFTRY